MDPVKGFSLIPKIASELKQRACEFRWFIIGGPENNEFSKVKSEIQKYDVEDVVFLLGAKRNPYPLLRASNLYVSTSFSEACPMVFLEAKTLGVPIVSADFGSAREFLNHDNDGYVISQDHMSEVLKELINIGQKRSDANTLREYVCCINLTMQQKMLDLLFSL